jgi:hypothetical protein
MKKVLWDLKNDFEACDCNGEPVVIEGGKVYVKDLGCTCDPGCPCGGCIEVMREYLIGGEDFDWKEI